MCFQDDAPDTKKDFRGDPVQDKPLPWECCPSFHLTTPSSFISFTKKETPTGSTGVHLTATNHVMWFHFQGTFWWEARLQESLCDTVGNVCAGQLRLYCMRMTFLGPLLRWWAETEIGLPAFGGGLQGTLSLLAATSDTTRHFGIRSI